MKTRHYFFHLKKKKNLSPFLSIITTFLSFPLQLNWKLSFPPLTVLYSYPIFLYIPIEIFVRLLPLIHWNLHCHKFTNYPLVAKSNLRPLLIWSVISSIWHNCVSYLPLKNFPWLTGFSSPCASLGIASEAPEMFSPHLPRCCPKFYNWCNLRPQLLDHIFPIFSF